MIPAACLPATGSDNTLLMALMLGAAALLIVVGVVAVRSTKGRIAMLAIAPLALAGLAISAPTSAAQAFEVAEPNFTASDTWTQLPFPASDFLSEDPTPAQDAFLDAIETEVTAGTATRSSTLTLTSPNGLHTVSLPLAWSEDDFDHSVIVTNETVFAGGVLLNAIEAGQGFGNLTLTLTHTYDYKTSAGCPLQTVVTYTGLANNPPPIP
jgi:LPXTG-motif cell wall-anchored protein